MNKVILKGRLTRDPEVRYSQGATPTAVAKFSLAVSRRFKKDGESDSDFFNCTAFGKNGEFVEKYFQKGQEVVVVGHLQTGSYEKDGVKRFTTDIIVEEQYFCGSKSEGGSAPVASQKPSTTSPEGFVKIDNDFDDDDIPF